VPPEVSVIIPCFNAERWLAETLTSVVAAGSGPIEVIVVDDGSTDRSAEVAAGFPQVQLIRSENRGVSTARNLGFAASRAGAVVFLDADDLLVPGALDTQLRVFNDAGADVVYGDWQRFAEGTAGQWAPAEPCGGTIDGDPAVAILHGVWRPAGAYLFRRSLVAEVGGFEPAQSVLADCRFYFECAVRASAFVHNPSLCCLYRVHRGGQSMATRTPRRFYEECLSNAEAARRYWIGQHRFTEQRKDVYLRVLDLIARGTARRYADLFAAACTKFEQTTGRRMPFGMAFTRWAVAVLGYRRYRWLQCHLMQ
jgi:glycosyltransferase involved in cell wall biosynthesis